MFKFLLIILTVFNCSLLAQDSVFYGSMNRQQLESYLARSIAAEFDNLHRGIHEYDDLVNMAAKYDARYLGQTYGIGYNSELPINYGLFDSITQTVNDIDSAYAVAGKLKPVIEAAIWENITRDVDSIWMSDEVTNTFMVPKRRFNYDSMMYTTDTSANSNSGTPDISRPETQMYFYFLATQYIKAGIESLHMGIIGNEDHNDTNHTATWKLLGMIRNYAKKYNRGLVLITADNFGLHLNKSDTLLYDFNSSPSRVTGVYTSGDSTWSSMWDYFETQYGGPGVINYNSCSPYGKMAGGLCYFGWYADTMPYMVKMDNTITDNCNCNFRDGCWTVYGFDESSWFCLQKEDYRNEWLCYAYSRVKTLDRNAFYRLPGRTLFTVNWDYYFAANGYGWNQEDEIGRIWNGEDVACEPNDITDIKSTWDKGNNMNDFIVLTYPNPASDLVNIIFNGPREDNISIRVTDEQGKIIATWKITDNHGGGYLQWNTTELLPGIYFCFATDEQGRSTAARIAILR